MPSPALITGIDKDNQYMSTFEYIKEYGDGIITVSDYELMNAFLVLVEKHKLIAENSGILPLAALHKLNEKNK